MEESISGVLTITTEKPTTALTANSVKLTAAERYVIEAGAFLAYKPAGSNKEVGNQVVAMTPDANNLEGYTAANATDFTPDAAGLYVFRRFITVDTANQSEQFSYEGYYFDGHDYYKISNLTITPDTGVDKAGDGVNTDGNLATATAGFYEEETKTVVPKLAYDSTANRLVASYDTGTGNTTDSTTLEALAKAYDDALIAYEDALEEYNAALREDTTADAAVVTANNTLQEKVDALLAAQKTLKEKQDALAVAQDAKGAADQALLDAQAAKTAADEAKEAADANVTTKQTAATAAEGEVTAAQTAVGTAQTAVDDADAAVTAANPSARTAYINYVIANSDATDETGVDALTYEQLTALSITNDNVNYNYYRLQVDLKKAQRDLADAEATLAEKQAAKTLADNALAEAQAKATAAETAAANAQTAVNNAQADVTAAQTAVETAQTAAANAQTAVDAAQADVTAAQTAYNNAVNAVNNGSTPPAGSAVNLTNAANALATAKQKLDAAKVAYENTDAGNSTGVLKININLTDNVVTAGGAADKWQLLPTAVTGNVAYFYYTSILGAGTTSTQLVESVELDDSVTKDMFKSFDFDLNVGLKSAQVTYDQDNNVLADAANETFTNAHATAVNGDGIVTWTTGSAAAAEIPQVEYEYVNAGATTTDNPAENGWYESDGNGGYKPTSDTEAQTGKTYYKRQVKTNP